MSAPRTETLVRKRLQGQCDFDDLGVVLPQTCKSGEL